MAALNGKWKLITVDNFVPYLDAIGVEGEPREKALKMLTAENNITQQISIQGDAIAITTTTPISTIEVKATSKQEFKSRFMDGREITTVFTVEGDTLREEISGSFSSSVVRAVEGNHMAMTMQSGDVKSTRRYEKA